MPPIYQVIISGMSNRERTVLLWKCLLPALILALLAPLPYSVGVRRALRQAQVARLGGDAAEEAAQLRAALAREPWRIELWEQIGRAEYAAGALEPAAQALAEAQTHDQLSDDGTLLLANLYASLHQPAQAQAALRRVLEHSTRPELRADAYQRLAAHYQQQGSAGQAVQALSEWQKEQPGSALANFQLGLHQMVLEPARALQPLLSAAELDSAYAARVQELRGAWNLAERSDDAAYRALLLGRGLANINEWELAEQLFRRAVTENAGYAEAWAFLSEALFHLQQDGAPEMEQALLLSPDSVIVRALAAVRYRRQGDPARALEYLRAVARQEPDEPIWQAEIGAALAQAGDLPAALAAYQTATTIAPQNSRYWQYLAQFCADYRYDLPGIGIPAARNAVILSPDDPAAHDVMGLALLAAGDWASAERFLQQALEHNALYAPAHLHMAMLHLQLRQFDQAHPFLERASSLDGTGPVAQVANRLLRQYYGEK